MTGSVPEAIRVSVIIVNQSAFVTVVLCLCYRLCVHYETVLSMAVLVTKSIYRNLIPTDWQNKNFLSISNSKF